MPLVRADRGHRPGSRDVLAAGRPGLAGGAEPAQRRRERHRVLRPVWRGGARQAAGAGVRGRGVHSRGPAGRVRDVRRARAPGEHGRPDGAEHPPLRHAGPHHGAQRRVRRAGPAGRRARLLRQPGARRHRLRALLRADHPAGRRARRRRRGGDRRRGPVDRRPPAGLVAERRRDHAGRAVGAALPGPARAARHRAAGRPGPGSRRAAGPARPQRDVVLPRARTAFRPVRRGRVRGTRRRERLAHAGPGRARARRGPT